MHQSDYHLQVGSDHSHIHSRTNQNQPAHTTTDAISNVLFHLYLHIRNLCTNYIKILSKFLLNKWAALTFFTQTCNNGWKVLSAFPLCFSHWNITVCTHCSDGSKQILQKFTDW